MEHPRPIVVEIDHNEYEFAAIAGFLRQRANVFTPRRHVNNRADSDTGKQRGYDNHIVGAIGEYVFARALRLPWAGPGKLGGYDVAGYQVRTTGFERGSLRLHPSDSDDAIYVLVTGSDDSVLRYCVRGWLYGREGKVKRYWADPTKTNRWAYLIPQSDLRSIGSLPLLNVGVDLELQG